MKKKIIISALIIFAVVIGTSTFLLISAKADITIQAACEQVVLDFTDGEPVEFDRVIGSDEENEAWRQAYSGDCVFKDEYYKYVVDSEEQYIKRISVVSNEAWSKLCVNGTKAGTEIAAESIALEIFHKIMDEHFVKEGSIISECSSHSEGTYFVQLSETVNGIPTGTYAGIDLSKAGHILGAVFSIGDSENTDKLINAKDGMISEEDAKKIALEKVNSMSAELEAENIQIDDSEPCEIMTLGDTTVWAVPFRYSKQGDDSYGGIVNVEVFSGEVYDIRMYA